MNDSSLAGGFVGGAGNTWVEGKRFDEGIYNGFVGAFVGAVTGGVLSGAAYGAGKAYQLLKIWYKGPPSAIAKAAARAASKASDYTCGAGKIGCALNDIPDSPEFGSVFKAKNGRFMPDRESNISYRFHDPKYETHEGIDFKHDIGSPMSSTHEGMAVVGANREWGIHVRVYRMDGSSSLYAHLSKVSVRTGDLVQFQQIVGETGNTGLLKSGARVGPHFHFGEHYANGVAFDPLGF